jgi:hypothetical protein
VKYAVILPAVFQSGSPLVVDTSTAAPSELGITLVDEQARTRANVGVLSGGLVTSFCVDGEELIWSYEHRCDDGWEVRGGFGVPVVNLADGARHLRMTPRWYLGPIDEIDAAAVSLRSEPLLTPNYSIVAEVTFALRGRSLRLAQRFVNSGPEQATVTLETRMCAAGLERNEPAAARAFSFDEGNNMQQPAALVSWRRRCGTVILSASRKCSISRVTLASAPAPQWIGLEFSLRSFEPVTLDAGATSALEVDLSCF